MIEKKVEKLINQLSTNKEFNELTQYRVTESFKKEREYILHNLTAEYEDDTLFFCDIEELIYEDTSNALIGIVIDSIEDIVLSNDKIDIILNCGNITIHTIR